MENKNVLINYLSGVLEDVFIFCCCFCFCFLIFIPHPTFDLSVRSLRFKKIDILTCINHIRVVFDADYNTYQKNN